MFTGIIREQGTVARVERSKGLLRLSIHAPKTASQVAHRESVAVNGACLSVVAIRHGTMTFEIIRETQALTTLGSLRRGDRVNLEPSLGIADRLSGLVMFGHVDGIGTVVARRPRDGEVLLELRVERRLHSFLVSKGPVAVDGVSLTVGQVVRSSAFTVHLIPETTRQTTLGARRAGDRVNVELDYFAKLIRQVLRRATSYAEDRRSKLIGIGTSRAGAQTPRHGDRIPARQR
jgi:riboflavin synthase alpha subunit